jgi:hypothetical protein
MSAEALKLRHDFAWEMVDYLEGRGVEIDETAMLYVSAMAESMAALVAPFHDLEESDELE